MPGTRLEGSKRRRKAESKPIAFRPQAAQPYDDRCLSWQYDQRTVSIWTVDGRVKNVSFVCSPDTLKMLQAHRQGESDLIERDGVFYLVATCDVPEAEQYEPDGFIGVDLGIENIATASTGYLAAGREILRRCEEVMRDVCTDFGAELREFNSERDHVHLLVHYPAKVAISRLVGSLKGVSARRLRQEFPGHIRTYLWGEHFWSPSYFAASCGGAPLAVIKEYIENQKRPG